ncbi:WD40 repeat-like protein, partial [Caulochytrium protostelioides]
SDGAFLLTVALTTNALEVYRVDTRTTSADEFATLAHRNALPGHRSDVRAVALSTTEDLILSTSQDEAKVWNRRTQTCVSSFSAASGLGVCCMFVPGNKMFLVGTKQGTLELFDIASNQHVWSLPAHEGAVWSMQMTNDRTGFVTGSADKTVKFWEFALEEVPLMDSSDIAGVELAGPMPTRRMLSVNHTRTLKMTEEVLAVALSPDDQFLAVSLLDSTVKVFYLDSLKFFLSLYGHKLPVLSMAIASDSTIIATASADKTIKLWGLDFGDCHRSWNAHNESVISIAFVWGTHYLFSAGKDGVLKYWDGDHGVLLQALPGHQSELWCLAVGKYGNTVVTGSKDRSLRIWSKTEDLFVPEEERDDQLERMHDLEMTARADRFANTGGIGSGVTPDDAAATGALVSADAAALAERGDATKKTLEALRATDRILEALEVWATDRPALDAYERALAVAASSSSSSSAPAKPTPSPYIMALGLRDTRPEFYVLHVMQAVRSGDLEEALVSLAFAKVTDLLHVVAFWCRMEWEPTFAARVLFALLRMHQRTIASTRTLRTTMAQIRTDLSATLRRQRDLLGWNVAALSFLDRHRAQAEAARVFIDDGATRRSAPTGTVEGVTQALQTVHIHGSKKATAAAKRKRLIITQ